MSIKVCAAELRKIAQDKDIAVAQDEIDSILKIMQDKIDRRGGVYGDSELGELIQEAKDLAQRARIEAAIQKRNRLINARAYATVMTALRQEPDDPGKALSAILVGDARRSLYSVDAKQRSVFLDHSGALVAELKRNDLLDIFRSNELDEKIYQEMFDGLGTSGSKEAQQIAEAIKKVQKRLLDRKNRNGSNIGELENYVVRQHHDPLLIRGKGTEEDKQEWITFVSENMDIEKTLANKPDDMTEIEFLGSMYDNLVSGNHMKADGVGGVGGAQPEFKGPMNLAKRLSAQRIIHFKDGKSALSYANKYSRMKLSEAVYQGISHDAQAIGLLETFGTNPKAMFEKILSEVRPKGVAKPIKEGRLKNQFAELDGTTRALGATQPILNTSVTYAGIAAGFRMVQSMAKLGFATISSFSDIATKASFINANTERNIFGSYATALRDTFRLFNSEEQKELAYLLSVGVENELADVHARFGANDSGPGMISKAHQLYFKLNGMQWWNSTQKVGVARLLAADLANYSSKPYGKIPAETRRLLSLYNINEAEWSLFRGMDMKAADGRKYLVPDIADEIPVEKIDPLIAERTGQLDVTDKMRQQFRDDLRTKISAYYSDSADVAIPTPGARERAIMNQGLPRGTVAGEAIRMIMQLKGFPITYVTKGLGRQKAMSGYYGIAKMMVGTTMMGYLSVTLKDILKGKEPMEVFSDDYTLNKDLLFKAFTQGGGAGIYGDFIFGEFNRYGQGPLETLAGPSFGTAADVLKIFGKFRSGDDAAAETVRLAMRNIPGANLFYAKLALDYLFMYELTEFANPGYFKRMERRMKKDTGQEFYFPPSQYVR